MKNQSLNVTIVSTYPAKGSKNIGDQLITNTLKSAILDVNPTITFETVFRADPWENVKDKILGADHIFFACLAIRKNMDTVEYPWLNKVIESKVPFSCIASGTDLPVYLKKNIYSDISKMARSLLVKLNKKATVFTSRGVLSQFFCNSIGLEHCVFNGDVAFYNKEYKKKKFLSGQKISKIVISDPHRAKHYLSSLKVLIDGLKAIFPEAKVIIAQHGINEVVSNFCKSEKIENVKIYYNPDFGLDIYNDVDLHVGYRVHAHVSALTRRKYSYLLEQDGRGCDYGLTLERKISIPNYLNFSEDSNQASVSAAYQMLALIQADSSLEFKKFDGLEHQIESFNDALMLSLEKSIKSTVNNNI